MKPHRYLALLLLIIWLLPASSAMAWDDDDEMTFEPDEVDWGDEDDMMTFAPDSIDDDGFDPSADEDQALDVGVVTVPSEAINSGERRQIQDALRAAAREIPGINVYGESDLLPALEDRDPDYCSTESLCLAGVGRAGGVQRILQARITERPDGYRLDVDYFDVENRLFASTHAATGLGSIDDIIEAIPASVDRVFGIRRARDDDEFVDVADVNALRIASYFSAGAAVVSLGLGTMFGLRVNSAQSDLEAQSMDGQGRYTQLTQQEAREIRRDMESDARIANFGIGAGLVLGATSVVLFIVSSGDDSPSGDELVTNEKSGRGLMITPQVDADRFGFGATWRF